MILYSLDPYTIDRVLEGNAEGEEINTDSSHLEKITLAMNTDDIQDSLGKEHFNVIEMASFKAVKIQKYITDYIEGLSFDKKIYPRMVRLVDISQSHPKYVENPGVFITEFDIKLAVFF